ncbi:glycosyltransferase [Bacillus sp. Marseille-P3661]|uniref:glycosyltransferase n=1 Tax=Bacillus sp. Marseille-P3661 TaxID=1936234 RepID=UPI0015E17FAF|nr:glycosyltransferase [Bacillus sp. Marseille-P3661]
MNIVYISCLSGNKSAGLTYSVPSQIESQSKVDNVFWYNLDPGYRQDNVGSVKCYSIIEFPEIKVSKLPPPFNCPDIVIFEGVYFINYYKIGKELKHLNIPYVIIPRSSLTKDAQQTKNLKKRIANHLFFNKFVNNAVSVQYLTEEEYKESGEKWNNNPLIIPNGTHKKVKRKLFKKSDNLKGVFIGRLDIYQKGLDLLLEACAVLKDEMKATNCTIDIYGPDQQGSKNSINQLIKKYELEECIHVYDAIFGEHKEKIILESDFFILTSRFEGHPMGLIEALSYGLPCLVTQGANMLDEISLYEAGWTAKTDTTSIIKAFKQLLNEKANLSMKGKSALELSQKYDWDEIAKVSSDKYKKMVGFAIQ